MYVYRKLENRLAVNKVCRYGRGEVKRGWRKEREGLYFSGQNVANQALFLSHDTKIISVLKVKLYLLW